MAETFGKVAEHAPAGDIRQLWALLREHWLVGGAPDAETLQARFVALYAQRDPARLHPAVRAKADATAVGSFIDPRPVTSAETLRAVWRRANDPAAPGGLIPSFDKFVWPWVYVLTSGELEKLSEAHAAWVAAKNSPLPAPVVVPAPEAKPQPGPEVDQWPSDEQQGAGELPASVTSLPPLPTTPQSSPADTEPVDVPATPGSSLRQRRGAAAAVTAVLLTSIGAGTGYLLTEDGRADPAVAQAASPSSTRALSPTSAINVGVSPSSAPPVSPSSSHTYTSSPPTHPTRSAQSSTSQPSSPKPTPKASTPSSTTPTLSAPGSVAFGQSFTVSGVGWPSSATECGTPDTQITVRIDGVVVFPETYLNGDGRFSYRVEVRASDGAVLRGDQSGYVYLDRGSHTINATTINAVGCPPRADSATINIS